MISCILALVLSLIGGINALLAAHAGTCTMSDAGHLGGILFSIPFYAVALIFLAIHTPRRMAFLTTLLLSPFLLWQAAFALNLGFRILALDQTACEILWGPPYGRDGSEITYAILWLGTGLGFPVLLALSLWHKRAKT